VQADWFYGGRFEVEIVTEHLVLREFVEGDLEAMVGYWSDVRYQRYYEGMTEAERYELAQKLVKMFCDNQVEEPRTKFQLAIALREDGRLIGNVGVRKDRVESTEGDMGCELAPDYWNMGYATEAVRAMIGFGFEELGLHRISASTMAANEGAWRVLEKVGMKREGELRETALLEGGGLIRLCMGCWSGSGGVRVRPGRVWPRAPVLRDRTREDCLQRRCRACAEVMTLQGWRRGSEGR
jgi:ribosomal-protein-alanine N-acetyltransferase